MLKITVPAFEEFDDENQTFITTKSQILQLEHSLVSLSKWESKWCKPFLSKGDKTPEETIDYIRCMTITQNVDPNVYRGLTQVNINQVKDYIDAPMTATVFSKINKKTNNEIITSEIIYYLMISMNIPFECQKWHLTRLLTLINVCNIKNQPSKKMNKREIAQRNAALNAARRQQFNSKG